MGCSRIPLRFHPSLNPRAVRDVSQCYCSHDLLYFYLFLHMCIYANEKRNMDPSCPSVCPFVCLSKCSFPSPSNRSDPDLEDGSLETRISKFPDYPSRLVVIGFIVPELMDSILVLVAFFMGKSSAPLSGIGCKSAGKFLQLLRPLIITGKPSSAKLCPLRGTTSRTAQHLPPAGFLSSLTTRLYVLPSKHWLIESIPSSSFSPCPVPSSMLPHVTSHSPTAGRGHYLSHNRSSSSTSGL